MSSPADQFSITQRVLHWLMAFIVLTMLFVGVGMVSTVGPAYETLVSIHRPLGTLILLLVLLRIAVRLRSGTPPLPADLPGWQVVLAKASHVVLYALMLVMPLVGWSMLSAGGYPIVLFGAVHLPQVMPHVDALHAFLRTAHTWLAYTFFVTIVLHFSAGLFHALIRHDGVFASMAPWLSQRSAAASRPPTDRYSVN